mmetsp:Transcript_7312/g.20625  ORF Transcript_7312/g.20625 Transcript_7312/m.20625 type:complete len:373 (-) Transcript_7312:70-1188(-)
MEAALSQPPAAKIEVMDCYGFKLKVTLEQQQERMSCEESLEQREKKWEKYLERRRLPDTQKLKKYLRRGVPPSQRHWVWMEVSGASRVRKEGVYREMVKLGETGPSQFKNQIELDLPRTFPGENDWISSEEGQNVLRRVLLAYSAHNQAVGYCQSMNYVAAVLLLSAGKAEEDAFWLLVAILEGILYPKMYSNNLEGCHVEMKSLGKLLEKKDSKLAAHMETYGCDVSLVATDWFLCLFCTTLPIETAARVWDAMFFEGPKVLYRVALSLFQMARTDLLKTDNPGDFAITIRTLAQNCYDHNSLMKFAFEKLGSMPMDRIDRYRQEKELVVSEEMRRREAVSRKKTLRKTIEEGKTMHQQYENAINGSANGR